MTADHTPERLSAEEAEALRRVLTLSHRSALFINVRAWALGILAAHLADVEARLAAVEALLTQWRHDLLTNPPTSMRDLGWVQGVEEALGQIEAALHPVPSEQPAQGGDDT